MCCAPRRSRSCRAGRRCRCFSSLAVSCWLAFSSRLRLLVWSLAYGRLPEVTIPGCWPSLSKSATYVGSTRGCDGALHGSLGERIARWPTALPGTADRARQATWHCSRHCWHIKKVPPLLKHFRANLASTGGFDQDCMVTFSLVRVRLGERRNRAIKLVASPQIAADDRRIARAGMRASQRPPAESRVQNKVPLRELFNIRGLFPVPQLANRAVNGPAA